MRRPVIGITVDSNDHLNSKYESPVPYARAIEMAGGLPLLLPYKIDLSLIPQYVDLIDGILFSGGSDLDPALYGDEQFHPKAEPIDPDRQGFEMALLAEVEKRRMPALGVCLGSQVMNVYRGGSLNQFLPDVVQEIEHRRMGDIPARHPVTMDLQSQLGNAIGSAQVSVNTYHKQSVKKLGKSLRVIATAPDGVIEGFEDPTLPLFAAVQWHPERLTSEKEHLAPFRLLVEKASASCK